MPLLQQQEPFALEVALDDPRLAGEGMPSWVTTVIGSNAITPCAIMAFILNLILPPTPPVDAYVDAAKEAAVGTVLPDHKK